jgi:small multidrug resistance pump
MTRAGYQKWFMAAAIYNVVWGTATILFPNAYFQAVGMEIPNYPSLFQAIGMIVMVYGLGYYLIAKQPERYAAFVWVGLLGKIFGPIGFVIGAIKGELPWLFGIVNITNDLIWLPVFILFAKQYAMQPFGPIPHESEVVGR